MPPTPLTASVNFKNPPSTLASLASPAGPGGTLVPAGTPELKSLKNTWAKPLGTTAKTKPTMAERSRCFLGETLTITCFSFLMDTPEKRGLTGQPNHFAPDQ